MKNKTGEFEISSEQLETIFRTYKKWIKNNKNELYLHIPLINWNDYKILRIRRI